MKNPIFFSPSMTTSFLLLAVNAQRSSTGELDAAIAQNLAVLEGPGFVGTRTYLDDWALEVLRAARASARVTKAGKEVPR